MSRTLAAAALAFTCLPPLPAHADGPLIVIDRWWGVDYAKESLATCTRPFGPPGKAEATLRIRKAGRTLHNVFELELKTCTVCSDGSNAAVLPCRHLAIHKTPKKVRQIFPYRIGVFRLALKPIKPRSFGKCSRRKGATLPMMQADAGNATTDSHPSLHHHKRQRRRSRSLTALARRRRLSGDTPRFGHVLDSANAENKPFTGRVISRSVSEPF